MDGLKYTFNGLGEYYVAKSTIIEVQGRTEQVEKNSVLEKATVFTSFAFKQITPSSEVVEIRLDSTGFNMGKYTSSSV